MKGNLKFKWRRNVFCAEIPVIPNKFPDFTVPGNTGNPRLASPLWDWLQLRWSIQSDESPRLASPLWDCLQLKWCIQYDENLLLVSPQWNWLCSIWGGKREKWEKCMSGTPQWDRLSEENCMQVAIRLKSVSSESMVGRIVIEINIWWIHLGTKFPKNTPCNVIEIHV